MTGEIEVYGVFFPGLLWLMLLAFAASRGLMLVLERIGVYRRIWHRSLFNLSLFVIVLGATVALTHGWPS